MTGRATSVLDHAAAPACPAIEVTALNVERGGRPVLRSVDLDVAQGELVALAGASGSGKTTLLEVLAGLRAPTSGSVHVVGAHATGRVGVGYVPQDDLVHRDLPLDRSLQHAAALTTRDDAEVRSAMVEQVLADLELVESRSVTVGQLSGGQRKRASVAVELLSRPDVLFLDEPTSGLDPATAAEVMQALRRLADRSVTVVVTSHHLEDLLAADRVVFLNGEGAVAYDGPASSAPSAFGVPDLVAVYPRVAAAGLTVEPTGNERPRPAAPECEGREAIGPVDRRPSAGRQLRVLTRRNLEILRRGRLTLAILIGSPILVISMMAVLFPAGALDLGSPEALGVQAGFWMAFAAFFFGLTYGLLQIVEEVPILQREHRSGVRLPVYVLAKVAVLVPLLGAVVLLLVAALRVLDRLPAADARTHAAQLVTLLLEAVASLALGLLASAAVRTAAQAALALPMLCFPQVLFAGAVVPVDDMPGIGRATSVGLVNRWGYEALGQVLGLPDRHATLAPWARWLTLAGLTVVCLVATVGLLQRRCTATARS